MADNNNIAVPDQDQQLQVEDDQPPQNQIQEQQQVEVPVAEEENEDEVEIIKCVHVGSSLFKPMILPENFMMMSSPLEGRSSPWAWLQEARLFDQICYLLSY